MAPRPVVSLSCGLAVLLVVASCADRRPRGDDADDTGIFDGGNDGALDDGAVRDGGDDADADLDRDGDRPDAPDAVEDTGGDVADVASDVGECVADERRCAVGGAQVCEGGRWGAKVECAQGEACYRGTCLPRVCQPNTAACIDDATVGICDSTGTTAEPFPCPEGSFCLNAQCLSACEPGAVRCDGPNVVECQPDGRTWADVETCDRQRGFECVLGECVSGCDAITSKDQYIGCDFWGVDTPNQFGLRNRFAFVVSNVDGQRAAHVQVENRSGTVIEQADLQPQQVATLRMPHPRTMNVNSSGVTEFGFHIVSDVPINAYQFNPLQRFDMNGEPVASNDASLLFPNNALGTEYIGVAFRHWGGYASFLSIVSTADGNEVTITPPVAVAGGPGLAAVAAGESRLVSLDRGQVLTLKSASAGQDLTGTVIVASENVGVFGGVDCAQIPVGADYCDHIEEKIFPLRAWDRTYYASKFQTRGNEADVYRVVASVDGTVITTEPSVGPIPVLNRGEWHEFESTADFQLEASEPVLLVQYMKGSSQTGSADNGDPSMLTVVPARQYREDYVFLVPDTYERDHLNITFPAGATITLDGLAVDTAAAVPLGETGFLVLRRSIEDGRHVLIASEPVGVSVYGYDFNISYAYPAGLDLSAVR